VRARGRDGAGQHYAIGLEAVACANRESLGRQQLEATRKDDVLKAIGLVAAALRSRLGESLASVERFNVPTTEATTASLDALRAVRQGDAARHRGQTAEALTLYRQAVSLDPEFALGLVRLGALATSAHFEKEGESALEKAYTLRDRVTLPERLEIDQAYHTYVTGDLGKVTQALETLRRTYPNSAGDVTRTSRIIAELDKTGWPGASQPDAGFMLAYRAALETLHRRPDRALQILRPFEPFELGFSWGFIPLYERAQANLAAGRWEAARTAFEKMLAHSGVSSAQKLLPMAQLGVGRALAAGSQRAESRKAYESFFALWKDADADLPLLGQARREYQSLP
jgi:tetratricopeptide (TPR) repeat protein